MIEERAVVVRAGRPGERVGRGAAVPADRRIVLDRPDQPVPDLRIVEEEGVRSHVVRFIGREELEKQEGAVGGGGRHVGADAPDGVPTRRGAHRGRTSSLQNDQKACQSSAMSASVKPASLSKLVQTWR